MSAVYHKSDILLASLPPGLDFLARVFKMLGRNAYYLSLSSARQTAEVERRRSDVLREAGIVPLPLEFHPHLEGILASAIDPQKKLQSKTDQIASLGLLKALECLYPNNADAASKLRTVVQSMIAGQVSLVGRVNCWANAHPDRKYTLICFSLNALLIFDLASNVRLWIVPMGLFLKGVELIKRLFRKIFLLVKRGKPVPTIKSFGAQQCDVSTSRVALVTHEGIAYGDLFEKTLFYSGNTESELHSHNLLHFDYSNFPSPSEKIKWVCLKGTHRPLWTSLYHVLVAITRGIIHVRSFLQLMGLLLLSRFYAEFMFYSKKLEAYPKLKLALIDYEILCPKALLLAFEAKQIKTVAAQERFSQSFYASAGSVLNTYFCGSEYMAGIVRKSSSYHIDGYFSVGQYKSDNLVEAKKSPPPQVLKVPVAQGLKIITALGFHTHMDWHNSQTDPLLNWMAHRHFLEDMVRLSKDIPNVFIILRFKMINWISLPVFTDVVRQIDSLDNIKISMDYEKSFFSYDLCANSDLVIAKHTSLGDECLAVGIPVLFHEYTHNTKRLVADAYDYSPARIMCFNYQELLERTKAVLIGGSAVSDGYEYLKNVVFGGLGDGKVRERIHTHINSLLEEHS